MENYVNHPYMNLTLTSVIKYTMSRSDLKGGWCHDDYHILKGLLLLLFLIILIIQYPNRTQKIRKIMNKIIPFITSIILYFLFPFYFFYFKIFKIEKYFFSIFFQNFSAANYISRAILVHALPPPLIRFHFQNFPFPSISISVKIFHAYLYIHWIIIHWTFVQKRTWVLPNPANLIFCRVGVCGVNIQYVTIPRTIKIPIIKMWNI